VGIPVSGTAAVLAIDGGNSKTDLALVALDGSVLASMRGPGASHEAHGIDGAMRILQGMVREVAAIAGLDTDAGPVAQRASACLAGADLPEEEDALTSALSAQGWSQSAVAMNDTFAVLRAGLRVDRGEPSWGAAVTCGAGINCVAIGPDGQVGRYLSWGRLTGDWGGGGDLGPEVVWHAARAEDGRGPRTALRRAVARHFGATSIADIAEAEHKGSIGNDDLRNLTRVLMTVADAGDPVAHSILARQADEICVMATAAMRRIGMPLPGTPVVLGGGVLESRNPLLLDLVMTRFAEQAPGALPRVVDVPPVAGAALLGLDHVHAAGEGHTAGAETSLRAAFRLSWKRGYDGRLRQRGPACPRRAGVRVRRARRPHLDAAPRRPAHAGRPRRSGTRTRTGRSPGLAGAVRDRGRPPPDPAGPGAHPRAGQDDPHVAAGPAGNPRPHHAGGRQPRPAGPDSGAHPVRATGAAPRGTGP
jgi:N-acetylglucosamine kinase-like BadF-type ATPase